MYSKIVLNSKKQKAIKITWDYRIKHIEWWIIIFTEWKWEVCYNDDRYTEQCYFNF